MDAHYDKLVPAPTPDTQPYWDGLKDHRLRLQRCADCGKVRHYPRPMCDACWSMNTDWVDAAGTGTVHSWTITHYAFHPGWKGDLPYLLLTVDLPEGVRMYTGDDFNYAELIAGDAHGHSHGLLGIFDPIAPVAALALEQLAKGNVGRFRELLDPTVALSREIFRAPTQYYKAGVVFLAWLNGHQRHFSMAGGLQSSRGITHYARVFELADACGVLVDPELAVQRMRSLLAVAAGDFA